MIDFTLKEIKSITPTKSNVPCMFYLQHSKKLEKKPLGLWTMVKIKKNSYIGEYKGEETKYRKSNYIFKISNKKDTYIDAKKLKHGSFLRYVNASLNYNDINAIYVQYKQRIYLKAIKDIKPRREIITYYGKHTKDIIES